MLRNWLTKYECVLEKFASRSCFVGILHPVQIIISRANDHSHVNTRQEYVKGRGAGLSALLFGLFRSDMSTEQWHDDADVQTE
jgi:hypothetical protein